MPAAPFPLVNGFLYSFASIEFDIAGARTYGAQAINWKEELSPEAQYANDVTASGETEGQHKATGDIEILLPWYIVLITRLGDGYMERRFNIGVQYVEAGSGLVSVDIEAARIISDEAGNAKGPAGATRKLGLSILKPIKTNGLACVRSKASVAAFTTTIRIG